MDFFHIYLKIFAFQNQNNVFKCISIISSKLYVLVALPLQEVFFRCFFLVFGTVVCDPLVWVVLEWSLMKDDESEIQKWIFFLGKKMKVDKGEMYILCVVWKKPLFYEAEKEKELKERTSKNLWDHETFFFNFF